MTLSVYHTPSSSDNLPTRTATITGHGQTFTYEITTLTERCWLLTASHTGVTRQFCSAAALSGFLSALREHLNTKYAAV